MGPVAHGSHRPSAVLVVERNAFAREGLACLLDGAGFRVAWKAAHPDQTVQLCRQFGDAVLVLAGLPSDRNRADVLTSLREVGLCPTVVALVDGSEQVDVAHLIALGVAGIVDRDEDPGKLFEAIAAAHAGGDVWLSPRVAVKLIPAGRNGTGDPDLTPREREMLWRVAHGQQNDQISDEMFISTGTVRNHLSNIYSKLGVHTRAEAVAWAWRTGLARAGVAAGFA